MARHARSFWEQRVAEVERGAPLEAVARRHGVNARTLQWWRFELRRQSREQAAPAPVPTLLPVVVRGGPARMGGAQVEITVGRAAMRVPVGTDVEYVAALVGAVARRC